MGERDSDAVYQPNSFERVVTTRCPNTGETHEVVPAPDPLTLARDGWSYDCASCGVRHTMTTETFGPQAVD